MLTSDSNVLCDHCGNFRILVGVLMKYQELLLVDCWVGIGGTLCGEVWSE